MNFISSNIVGRLKSSLLPTKRFFQSGRILKSETPAPKEEVKEKRINPALTDMKVGKFEKYILVWGGKYKKIEDVPNFVNQSVLEKARNKARVKINIYMGIGTLIACVIMVYLGKKAAERGDTITKIHSEHRKEIMESYAVKK